MNTYDVVWVVNGFVKEHLAYNKPFGIARWIKDKAQATTHRSGKVELRKN